MDAEKQRAERMARASRDGLYAVVRRSRGFGRAAIHRLGLAAALRESLGCIRAMAQEQGLVAAAGGVSGSMVRTEHDQHRDGSPGIHEAAWRRSELASVPFRARRERDHRLGQV